MSGAPNILPEFAGSGTVSVGVDYDFNADGHPDYVLYNASTRQTAIWYLNNNVYLNGRYGPTLPANWVLVDVADISPGTATLTMCCVIPLRARQQSGI